MPVAFVKKQGTVTLTNTCSPTSFTARDVTHCSVSAANLGSTASNATLNVSQVEKGKALDYLNVGPPGSVIGNDDGVQWSGLLSPALPPSVTGFTLGGGESFGYVPLSALGVGPVSGVGDDTISNFTLPTPILYGHEQYTRIGVVSNGYVVLGGGDATDIVFMPQHFPNPARPNNVIAPLWTDLRPAGGGGAGNLYVATLSTSTAPTQQWVVVDWEGVKNFNGAVTHSFEIWIATTASASGEQVTIAYGPGGNAATGDSASGVNWGAENRTGTSGANIAAAPADSTQYSVNLTPPTAGGAITIPFDITAKKPGTYTSRASLTSDTTSGTTVVDQPLTVTP